MRVYPELFDYFLLDISKSLVGLYFDEDAVSYWEIDWNGDLPSAHQGHHLIFYWHVTDHRRIFGLSKHFFE